MKPGSRWKSAVCEAQLVVVRPPNVAGELQCGGAAVVPIDEAGAPTGTEFALQVNGLSLPDREAAVRAEVRAGNVPAFWREFVEVRGEHAVFSVAPDYLCVGSDEDYWLAPLTPTAAQLIADDLGCILPTRKMVDEIYRAAPLKLAPSPIVPSKAMTTVPVFNQHNATVRAHVRRSIAGDACRATAGPEAARSWKPLRTRARSTIAPGSTRPSASSRTSIRSSGNRRIHTTWSRTRPSPPTTMRPSWHCTTGRTPR